jgi:hypothetical protein
MLIDSSLDFVTPGTPQAITTTAPSNNQIDLTVKEDLGIGIRTLPIAMYVGTGFTTSTSLNTQLQSSPDNVTYYTIIETGVIAVAQLIAQAKIRFDLTPRQLAANTNLFDPLHRYLRLNFVVAGSAETTGTIAWAGIVLERDDQDAMAQYPAGYSVGA